MTNIWFQGVISERAAEYAESPLLTDVEASAVVAIYCAWIAHTSSIARLDAIKSELPLDHYVLFKAAALAFDSLSASGPVGLESVRTDDRDSDSIKDQFLAFADQESKKLGLSQDMDYYQRLFCAAIQEFGLGRIANGNIARSEIRPLDLDLIALDYW